MLPYFLRDSASLCLEQNALAHTLQARSRGEEKQM